MDREIMRRVILEYQDVISQIQLVERPFSFEEGGNYVFVGVRQAGKSYLLYQQAGSCCGQDMRLRRSFMSISMMSESAIWTRMILT